MSVFTEKSVSKDFLYIFQKLRPLCSHSIKIIDFSGFSNSFSILDIYKCPKSVCESKMGKNRGYAFGTPTTPNPPIPDIITMNAFGTAPPTY